jgi:hypothetical protein
VSGRLGKESTKPKVTEPPIFQPVAWYSRKLDTHPILTKCISSGIVSGCGDVLGQYIVVKKHKKEWDPLRTGRFMLLGFALVAPIIHVWYGSLMVRFPGHGATAIAKRVFLDQAFFAPLFLPMWLLNLWVLEGRSHEYVLENVRAQVPKMIVANWELWIPAQIVNLGFVPPKYQVLFSNLVAVVWNTYLSYTTHDPE